MRSVKAKFVPYRPVKVGGAVSLRRVRAFRKDLDGRRTVRMFDPKAPVSRKIIEEILAAAGTAPSGAHKQPWTFIAISTPELKQKIRAATEEQEKKFYEEVAPEEWLRDLAPLGTDFRKAHLTDAPWLVVIFAQDYALGPNGEKRKHYYVNESVGIACGFMLAAIRRAGLVALTHTPSPMTYLRDLLGRPKNERTYLVIPIGYPAKDCKVPDLRRKGLDEFVIWK
jgi:iodotyrosine deiodinase